MRTYSLNALALRAIDETTATSAPATVVAPTTTAPAPVPATSGKPISKAALRAAATGATVGTVVTVKAATPARRVAIAKPAPIAVPAKLATKAPAAATGAKPASPPSTVTRTITTIARHATNFGNVSDRDEAYLAFYAGFAKRAANGIVTVRAIAESGKRPAYNGSSKPHDAGVVNRLTLAGFIKQSADSTSFTFTDKAKAHKLYASAKA